LHKKEHIDRAGCHLPAAKLRHSKIDDGAGSVDEVARIIDEVQCRWPRARILLRGGSGFCREDLMAWCEANRVITCSASSPTTG